MPVKSEIPFDHGHFFITFTCYKWLLLIDITDGYDLVYNWFNILNKQGHFITGYVIMPNHLHATIAFRKTGKNINKIIGDGKRFIGYAIVKRLKEKGLNALLQQLENGCWLKTLSAINIVLPGFIWVENKVYTRY